MSYNFKYSFPDVPEDFHNRVLDTLNQLPENKEMEEMKLNRKFTWKKAAAFAAVATLVIGTSTYAAGKITSYVGCTTKQNVYQEAPSEEKVYKDYGMAAKIPDAFSNGYTFKRVDSGKVSSMDDSGNKLETINELYVDYQNEDDNITLFVSKVMNGESIGEGMESQRKIGDIDVYYDTYVNKIVPDNYKLTEQDKKDEEAGKYVFSYGDAHDDVRIVTVQGLTWIQDDVKYSFCGLDTKLTEDELYDMAEEMIG